MDFFQLLPTFQKKNIFLSNFYGETFFDKTKKQQLNEMLGSFISSNFLIALKIMILVLCTDEACEEVARDLGSSFGVRLAQ